MQTNCKTTIKIHNTVQLFFNTVHATKAHQQQNNNNDAKQPQCTLMSTRSPFLYTFMYVDNGMLPCLRNFRSNMWRVPRRYPFGFVILVITKSATPKHADKCTTTTTDTAILVRLLYFTLSAWSEVSSKFIYSVSQKSKPLLFSQ